MAAMGSASDGSDVSEARSCQCSPVWSAARPATEMIRPGDRGVLFDENAFHEPGDQYGLSKVARGFIAGLPHHSHEITAITNQ